MVLVWNPVSWYLLQADTVLLMDLLLTGGDQPSLPGLAFRPASGCSSGPAAPFSPRPASYVTECGIWDTPDQSLQSHKSLFLFLRKQNTNNTPSAWSSDVHGARTWCLFIYQFLQPLT